jgi:hypothetical protein
LPPSSPASPIVLEPQLPFVVLLASPPGLESPAPPPPPPLLLLLLPAPCAPLPPANTKSPRQPETVPVPPAPATVAPTTLTPPCPPTAVTVTALLPMKVVVAPLGSRTPSVTVLEAVARGPTVSG